MTDQTFFARFEALCRKHSTTPNAVAKAIGASSGSVTAWKRGAAPRNDTLRRIADFFHVSADYLLTGREEPDLLDAADVAFYGEYRELSEDEKRAVRDMVRLLRDRRPL